MQNIGEIVDLDLCIGCGMCYSVCPQECISLNIKKGRYLPFIDKAKCIKCGVCRQVCPGVGFTKTSGKDSFFGDRHGQGIDAIEFYTERKVVITRWW